MSDYRGEGLTDHDWLLEPLDESRMLCETCAAAIPGVSQTGELRRGVCDSCNQDRGVCPHS